MNYINNLKNIDKLTTINKLIYEKTQKATIHIAEGGFNKLNISSLESRNLTEQENNNINQKILDLKTTIYESKLKKPDVPIGACYPNEKINELVVEKMWNNMCSNKYDNFYTQNQLQYLVNCACKHNYIELSDMLNISIDETTDISILGLYDIIVLLNDNLEMKEYINNTENVTKFNFGKELVKTIYNLYNFIDVDGINIRFVNSLEDSDGVHMAELNYVLDHVFPTGSERIENSFKKKIIDDIIEPLSKDGAFARPILVIIITNDDVCIEYEQYKHLLSTHIILTK